LRPGADLFFLWPIILLVSNTLQIFSAAVEIPHEQSTRDRLLVIRLLCQLKERVPTPGARRATGLVRPWSVYRCWFRFYFSAPPGLRITCHHRWPRLFHSYARVPVAGLVLSLIFTGCRSVLASLLACVSSESSCFQWSIAGA
jgi:hypothetical protein